jgi:hypothetical protein
LNGKSISAVDYRDWFIIKLLHRLNEREDFFLPLFSFAPVEIFSPKARAMDDFPRRVSLLWSRLAIAEHLQIAASACAFSRGSAH